MNNTVSNIHSTLYGQAKYMAKTALYRKKTAPSAILNFLKEANKTQQYSIALMAYYSALYRINKSNGKNLNNKINSNILDIVHNNANIKNQADIFTAQLAENYPNSLSKRIKLLQSGAIDYNRVKPQSTWKFIKRILKQYV